MNIKYHAHVESEETGTRCTYGLGLARVPNVWSCKRKRPSYRFLPHRRQSYRDHNLCCPNGLEVLLNASHCSSGPKRPTAQRQYSHHISRTTHHSVTDCRCYDIQHFTPVRRTSYRAAPLSSWRQKRSGFSSVT